MNILFITNLYPGKPNHSVKEVSYALHNFAKVWQHNGCNVIVFRPLLPSVRRILNKKTLFDDVPEQHELDGIRIYNIRCLKIRNISFFLSRYHTSFIPDVVVGHMTSSFVPAKKIAKKLGIPYVLGIHNSDLACASWFRKEFDDAAKISCRSYSVKKHFLDCMPQYADKVFIANSCIESNVIENHAFFEKKEKEMSEAQTSVFTTVSLLQKLKNIDVTIMALSKYKEWDWQYYIIGDGEEREHLESLINLCGLQDKIHILGLRSRDFVLDYLKRTHYFVMVSAPETFGLAYLEAMAKANVIIGCRNWGIAGVIKDGENGFLLEERKQDELEKLIGKILAKQINLNKILCNEERTIHEYTQENTGNEYQRLLESVVTVHKQLSL